MPEMLIEKFEEQVVKTPDRVAVKERENWLTYRELNRYACRVACGIENLCGKTANSETVGLLFEHGPDMIAAILGTLKAGKVYVPLSAGYPPNRLSYMLTHSQSPLILTNTSCEYMAKELAGVNGIPYFNINRIEETLSKSEQGNNPGKALTGDRLAYIMYTSGSTGRPKGVMQTHENVWYYIRHWKGTFSITAADRMTLFSSFCHDGSVQDMFSALLSGAVLFPLNMKNRDTSEELTEFLIKERITIWHSVPSLYNYFVNTLTGREEFKDLRFILLGGEAVRKHEIDMFKRYFPHSVLADVYGQTESSVNSIRLVHPQDTVDKFVIGEPLEDTEIFVVDAYGNEVDALRTGEILVACPHLSPGYWRDEETTAKSFDSDEESGRLYWTGDLGRLLLDGNIEFIGRKDSQVKIRGFRVELGEIESHLLRYPGVKETVVTAGEDRGGDKYLCAYIVPGGINGGELRDFLSKQLPDYMVPSFFVPMEKLPLTASGKIHRKALPEPEIKSKREYVAPGDEIEKTMVRVWSEVLGIRADAIGMKDNFFELGGHSLKATVLVYRVHKVLDAGITLSRVFKTPTVKGLCDFVKKTAKKKYTDIPLVEEREYYELSPAQKRLFILQQMETGSTGYNMPRVVELEGGVDFERLQQTFTMLIGRHESLRTSFHMVNEEPVQRIHKRKNCKLHITNIIENFVQPFDLSIAPLVRVGIVSLEKGRHVLMVDIHHIITDGTAQRILVEEFMKLYKGAALPPLKLRYRDYARWQNGKRQRQVVQLQEKYWLEEFAGEIPVLNLPLDYPRPLFQSFEGRTLGFSLTPEETRGLNNLARQEDATLYMVLACIVNVLLSKLSGQEEIVAGTAVAGRNHAGLRGIIGMFVNTLALRNRLPGELSFKAFLKRLREKTLKAFENQEYPFEDLVEKVEMVKDAGRNPLFDVMFTLQNLADFGKEPREKDETAVTKQEDKIFENRISKFDLSLVGMEAGERLRFSFQYCTRLFKEETVRRFAAFFKRITASLLENPGKKIADIDIITESEKQRILFAFNDDKLEYPADKTIQELFEQQARRTPDNIALVGPELHHTNRKGVSLSYRELHKKSDRLAYLLEEKGIRPDAIVGMMLERSLDMIIGILAILKAGGAYLPIEPGYPGERINYMLSDSNATFLLKKSSDINNDNVPIVLNFENLNFEFRTSNLSPSGLAYVIYTSGTTGKPKGVMIEHRNVVRLVKKPGYIDLLEGERLLMTGSVAFDITTFEIWGALLNGLSLYLTGRDTLLEPGKAGKIIVENRIRILHLVPQLFERMAAEGLEIFAGLRYFLVGGDLVKPGLINELRKRYKELKILHMYGPTENTTFSTFFPVEKEYETAIPIGKPIGTSCAYVVGKNSRLQPVGIVGELYVGGAGVSRGYLNRPELTAERFVNFSPMSSVKKKIYKTGDLAKRLPDGNIEFLGRNDLQVKIRGHRIELGEIENRLLNHHKIKEAAVTIKEGDAGTYLCAYIVSGDGDVISGLREWLSRDLPGYMIPSYFVDLEHIPLTPNGKVNRKALPNPEFRAGDDYVAPENEIEEKLAGLWSEVLGIKKGAIGINADFFELGGHSLKATILVSKIFKELQVKIPLAEIFKAPTLRGLSEYIKGAGKQRYLSIKPVEKKDYYPLSSAQKRLYILQQMKSGNVGYNMPQMIPLPGGMDKEKLESIFRKLISRHESLRTSFHMVNGQPVQRIHNKENYKLQITNNIKEFIQPFDLSEAPLMRIGIVKSVDANRLLIDMHHIITDGTSQAVLRNEFIGIAAGEALPPSRFRYVDFSEWQSSKEQQDLIKKQEAYWLKEFSCHDEFPVLHLPADYPRPLAQSFEGRTIRFVLNEEETRSLKKLAKETNATLYMSILAVFNILLWKLSGQEDIVVGTPVAARSHADLEGIVGMFVNTLALRNYPSGNKTLEEFLQEVKERTLGAFENQDYPFEELVENVAVQRDSGRNPVFDVMLTLQNLLEPAPAKRKKVPGFNVTRGNHSRDPGYEIKTSKFDLTLRAVEIGNIAAFTLEYCTRLFKPGTVKRFINYFKKILSSIPGNYQQKISAIDLIAEEEKQRILVDFNRTYSAYPGDRTIVQLFEQQVERTPDNIALVNKRLSITYRELNKGSDRLAYVLWEKGIRPDTIVGMMLERSLDMIIGILGILKAGGAYLPVDPGYPQERIDYMLADSGAKILLTEFPKSTEKMEGIHHSSFITHHSGHLAYIIYTSGTTGKPKGVAVEHGSLVNLASWYIAYFNIADVDKIAQYASLGFDGSVKEIFPPLIKGASVHILGEEIRMDPAKLNEYFERHCITVGYLPTRLCEQFMEQENDSLRVLLTGGDKLEKFTRRNYRLYNVYGPTEDTVVAAACPVDKQYDNIPIGKPIANNRIYILSGDYRRIQPIGIVGELCIGGDSLARGYLNNPALTGEKFFNLTPRIHTAYLSYRSRLPEKIYGTGDLARWLPDGNIEFLGRKDGQVKIRGFRIELGEIEFHLKMHRGIKDVVVLKSNYRERQFLCAYFTPVQPVGRGLAAPGLREYLSGKIPGYMIPTYFVPVDQIPLTANGKVNRKALPQLEANDFSMGTAYVAPKTGMQRIIAGIWQEVLGKDKVGIRDNFFDLGGNSLDFIKVANKLNEKLEKDIAVVTLFTYPTISSLDHYLSHDPKGERFHETQSGRWELIDEGKALMQEALTRIDQGK